MSHVKSLRCRECDNEYPIEPLNVCEFCFGPLEVSYDYESISRSVSRKSIEDGPLTMWRYHDFLPVEAEDAVDLGTGFTPLLRARNLGRLLGLDQLYIKNDSVNPTFSFKDRPVSVTTTKALEFEFDVLACPSTGNLMGAVAAHGAKAGMKTMIFFPADLEKGKIIGAAIYGPTLIAVDGTYDQVNRLCSELADNNRWAFVNINMRPFYAEAARHSATRWPNSSGGELRPTALYQRHRASFTLRYGRGSRSCRTLGSSTRPRPKCTWLRPRAARQL